MSTKREIKFRAWDGERFYCNDSLEHFQFYLISGHASVESDWDGGQEMQEWPIEQYTGLKDANGVEIYEGDLWKRGQFIGEVKFEYGAWHFYATKSSPTYEYPAFHGNAKNGVIIGNIHENPELLEGGE